MKRAHEIKDTVLQVQRLLLRLAGTDHLGWTPTLPKGQVIELSPRPHLEPVPFCKMRSTSACTPSQPSPALAGRLQ